jgi:hypothetical protein
VTTASLPVSSTPRRTSAAVLCAPNPELILCCGACSHTLNLGLPAPPEVRPQRAARGRTGHDLAANREERDIHGEISNAYAYQSPWQDALRDCRLVKGNSVMVLPA